jgi:NAD(P)-dependent dehydrogenase (short-subunit alcohol dehydrogenase family)
MTIAGKSVVVTGASRGIGQALVEEQRRKADVRRYTTAGSRVSQ